MKKFLCVMIALSAAFAGLAFAQPAFPSKPLRLVVGFPPGGANAIIATESVARSAPDGYTLLVGAVLANEVQMTFVDAPPAVGQIKAD